MPGRRLHVAVGLAEGRRRHEAPPLLERLPPKLAHEDCVVAHVRDAPRCSLVLQEHKAPAHRHDLPLAIIGTAHDRCDVAWGRSPSNVKVAPPVRTSTEADAMHALLTLRADAFEECADGSPEEAEFKAIADALVAYEAKRWPKGHEVGGKGLICRHDFGYGRGGGECI